MATVVHLSQGRRPGERADAPAPFPGHAWVLCVQRWLGHRDATCIPVAAALLT